jgi:hypothetical protein
MRFTTARGALVALLAVVIVSVVGAALASASTQCELNKQAGSAEYTLCVEGKQIGSPSKTLTFASKSHLSNFVLAISSESRKIVCSESNLPGHFTGNEELNEPLGLTFGETAKEDYLNGCKLEPSGWAKKCTVVKQSYLPDNWDGVFSNGVGTLTVKPGGTYLLLFSISNNGNETCPGALKDGEVYGEFPCKVGEAEVEKVEHELSCKGKVTYEGPLPATIEYTQMLSLAGEEKGKKFSFFEST